MKKQAKSDEFCILQGIEKKQALLSDDFFLKELKKNYEKTGFSRKSGPNLISFAFNRGARSTPSPTR